MTRKQVRAELEAQEERIAVQGKELEEARSETNASRQAAIEQREHINFILRAGARIRHVAHKIADSVQTSVDDAGRMLR